MLSKAQNDINVQAYSEHKQQTAIIQKAKQNKE